jgi:hypothetical protein
MTNEISPEREASLAVGASVRLQMCILMLACVYVSIGNVHWCSDPDLYRLRSLNVFEQDGHWKISPLPANGRSAVSSIGYS